MPQSDQCRVQKKYWKASHRCWYCHILHPDGRDQDRRLKPDEEAAEGLRQEIIKEVQKAGRPSLDCTVDHLIQAFLAHTEANNAPATFKWRRNFLASFKRAVGTTLSVRDLDLHHVQRWLAKAYPATGNTNTRHGAVACVKRMLNWAVNEMHYFDRNPLAALRKPPQAHRATCLTKDQWATVLEHFGPDDPFHDFLSVLVDTGCRPQELRVVEARQIDLEARLIRFADGEIPGKRFGRDVIVPERTVGVLRKWALKHAQGPVFRNEDGNPWTKGALNCRLRRLKGKLPFRVTCYTARHSKATDILENGGSAGAVATILGHRDPTMVLKFYGKHIEQRAEHLRDLVEKDSLRSPRRETGAG